MTKIGKTVVGLVNYTVPISLGASWATGPYIASEDGVIDSISVYTETTGVNLRLGVYLHDEATLRPTSLLASTDPISISQPGWQTGTRTGGSGVIEKGKRYWIAFIASGDITYKLNRTEEVWWRNSSGPYPTLRNPWLMGGGSTIGQAMSAYFSYTPHLPDANDLSLQARINRAAPGSTVRIRYGFYNEQLRINKPLKLVGVRDRRGRLPIIQGGSLLPSWQPSLEPEHSGKNVWYADVSINGTPAKWVRSLQLGDKGVQVLQAHPLLAGEGGDEAQATAVRTHVLTCDWSSPGYFLVPNQTIDFWEWYDAIACHTTTGRLWIRLKNNVNPNDYTCYVTLTQNTRISLNDDWNLTNELASVIKCENQQDVTIRNLEVRGGRYGIDIHNSSNVLIEKCKVVTPALRSINICDCTNVTIQANEITSNRMRTNIGPGFGGTSDRAKAMMFGWSLNKNYSTSGHPSPAGHSIELVGVTTNVIIRRNWMHGQGSGIGWGYGNDAHLIDAIIENNRFEKMDSTGVVVYQTASGIVRNNIFYEVHLNFRIQGMMEPMTIGLGPSVTIENNYIHTLENAGYLLQAHYGGTHATYNWTIPIVFSDNLVRNVSTFIANLLGFANVSASGNVIDCSGGYSAALATHGMTSFTNNWVGGNAEHIKNLTWFDSLNDYVLNRRLPLQALPPLPELPDGFEEVGPYRQNVGLPMLRRPSSGLKVLGVSRSINGSFGGN